MKVCSKFYFIAITFFKSVTTESRPPPNQSPTPTSPTAPVPSQPGSLTPEQRAKLQSELDVVQSNMTVLGEMLYELKPGEEQPDELELLQVRFFVELFQTIQFFFIRTFFTVSLFHFIDPMK